MKFGKKTCKKKIIHIRGLSIQDKINKYYKKP